MDVSPLCPGLEEDTNCHPWMKLLRIFRNNLETPKLNLAKNWTLLEHQRPISHVKPVFYHHKLRVQTKKKILKFSFAVIHMEKPNALWRNVLWSDKHWAIWPQWQEVYIWRSAVEAFKPLISSMFAVASCSRDVLLVLCKALTSPLLKICSKCMLRRQVPARKPTSLDELNWSYIQKLTPDYQKCLVKVQLSKGHSAKILVGSKYTF